MSRIQKKGHNVQYWDPFYLDTVVQDAVVLSLSVHPLSSPLGSHFSVTTDTVWVSKLLWCCESEVGYCHRTVEHIFPSEINQFPVLYISYRSTNCKSNLVHVFGTHLFDSSQVPNPCLEGLHRLSGHSWKCLLVTTGGWCIGRLCNLFAPHKASLRPLRSTWVCWEDGSASQRRSEVHPWKTSRHASWYAWFGIHQELVGRAPLWIPGLTCTYKTVERCQLLILYLFFSPTFRQDDRFAEEQFIPRNAGSAVKERARLQKEREEMRNMGKVNLSCCLNVQSFGSTEEIVFDTAQFRERLAWYGRARS